jgi:hypothetical protein
LGKGELMAGPWEKYGAAKAGGPWEKHVSPSGDMAARAAAMSPEEKQAYRIRNRDPLAEILMQEVQQQNPGETPQQMQQRLALGSGKPLQEPSKMLSAVGGAADTLSWGAGDEMAAGLKTLTGPRTYEQNLEDQRRLQSTLQGANPKSYLGGQVAGAIVPGLVTGGGSAAVGMGGKIATSAGLGALQGGAYGFNSGEGGAENRMKSAGTNAVIGAFTGGAAPVVAKGVGAAWNGVMTALNNRGIPAKAQNMVLSMLQEAGLTPQQAMQKLDGLGPDAMLADIAPGMQTAAGGTALQTPSAQTLMAERLANRRGGGQTRMWSALDDAFGPAKDPFLVKEGTKAAKSAINPAYGRAIAGAPELPKSVQELTMLGLTNPTVGKSLSNRTAMLGHMNEIDDALAAGNPQDAAGRLLDYRKRLDSMIVYDPRERAMMQPSERALQDVHKQARSYVDEILKDRIPGIAEADAAHAPLSRQQAAFDIGRRDLLKGGSETMTPAELQSRMKGMVPQEVDMLKQGARTEIDRVMSNQRREPSGVVDRITSRDWNREKLRTLTGNAKVDRLGKAIDREGTFLETSNLVEPGRGSRTAVLDAAKKHWGGGNSGIGDALTSGTMAGAASGSPAVGAATAVGVAGRGWAKKIIDAFSKPNEKKVAAVADFLTRAGPERDAVVRQIADKFLGSAKTTKQADAISRVVESLIGPQRYPALAAIGNRRENRR